MSEILNQIDISKIKKCVVCKKLFYKNKRSSKKQWEFRLYCSIQCHNKVLNVPKKTIAERFWIKVDKRNIDDCWNWLGAKTYGYGILSNKPNKSPMRAPRISWELHFGKIDEGLVVCHKCDNPSCVNPNHLFIGTMSDNLKDCARKGRINPKSLLNLIPGNKRKDKIRKEEKECQKV